MVSSPEKNLSDDGENHKVQDEEASNQQARLRSIQQAWQGALDRRAEARDSALTGTTEREDRLWYYRTGVEQFLMQLVSLARRTEAKQYWEEEKIGEVVIPLPEKITEALDDKHVRIPWGASVPEPKRVEIIGLFGFLNRDWPVSHLYELDVGRYDTIRETGQKEAPMALLDQVMVTALDFLGDTGLDIEVAESEHRAVVDEEVLKEIEQWRQQNIE